MRAPLIPVVSVALVALFHGNGLAQEAFFDSNGVKIRYVVEGQGEPVVLLHGFTGRAEMWSKKPPNRCSVWPELAKQYRVIAVDCRGHGKSDKPHDPAQYGMENVEDVVRLLDRLQIKKAHVVGYSMGAIIAGRLAVAHPDRLISVVCGGGVPLFAPTKEIVDSVDVTAKGLEEGNGLVPVILAAKPAPGRPKATPEVAKAISRMIIGDQDQKALAACTRGGLKLEVTEAELRANKVPSLVVYGSKEGDGNEAVQKAFRDIAKLMGAEVQVIEGSDHVGTLARPELAQVILAFLQRHKA
jgi:pimeloyl-ACP methyl ester carboxylesterase